MHCIVSASAQGLLPVCKQSRWRDPVETVGFSAGHHVTGLCGDGTLLS